MRLLPLLAVWSVLGFAGVLGLALFSGLPRQAPAHLAFAAAAMPLILAAMGHFVPVLTRSGEPPRAIRHLPLLALAAGLGVTASFAWPAWWVRGASLAALGAIAAALAMAAWTRARARATLGAPHPGLWWYLAALLCLAGALLAVPAMEIFPAGRPQLRLLHLHLNTLGFVGLTALGTLQVLLPTAAGRPDRDAAGRLRRALPLAVLAVTAIALGAALGGSAGRGLAGLGLIAWLWLLAGPALAWWRLYPSEILALHGAVASLHWALLGLVGLSVLHGTGLASGPDAIGGYFLAFLLPLVTGAVSQLLPVWLRPGRQGEWHERARRALGRGAGLRGAALGLSGLAFALGWHVVALTAVPALAQFLAALPAAVRQTSR